MRNYLKYKPAWQQLLIFGGLTIGIALVISILGSYLVAKTNGIAFFEMISIKPAEYADPKYRGMVRGLLVVQFFGIFLVPSLLFAYFADPSPLRYAGLKRPDKLSFIFLGILVIVCCYPIVEWLGLLNQEIIQRLVGENARAWIIKSESEIGGSLKNILTMNNTSDLVISIILVGILAAVGEELFFRGILQKIFIRLTRSPWWGIIITAIIFSAFHGQFLGFLPRMILGIILGALYWYSGSLFPAILGHFVFNSLQVLLVYYRVIKLDDENLPGNDSLMNWMGIAALAAVIGLFYVIKKQSKSSYARMVSESRGIGPRDEFIA